jgi:hypothetical protein
MENFQEFDEVSFVERGCPGHRRSKLSKFDAPNKLWVHSDNVRPHTAKMSKDYISRSRMKQAPHPPIRQIWHPRTFSFLATSRES